MAEPMNPPRSPDAAGPPRRFTIGDAMIVVALAAVLLAAFAGSVVPTRIARYVRHAPGVATYLYLGGPMPAPPFRGSYPAALREYLWTTPGTILAEVGLPLLPLATLAFVPIRLRRPRPPWRDLLRQPGMAGVAAAILAAVVEVDLRWLGVPIPTPLPIHVGLAIAGAWAVLGVSRLGRSEPGWIDRLGRGLGAAWVALGASFAAEMIRGGWAP